MFYERPQNNSQRKDYFSILELDKIKFVRHVARVPLTQVPWIELTSNINESKNPFCQACSFTILIFSGTIG